MLGAKLRLEPSLIVFHDRQLNIFGQNFDICWQFVSYLCKRQSGVFVPLKHFPYQIKNTERILIFYNIQTSLKLLIIYALLAVSVHIHRGL